MPPRLDDTICALATPPGTGGIGVIRLSGPNAFTIADAVTRRPKNTPCRDCSGHTLHRALVLDATGETIDTCFSRSFTARAPTPARTSLKSPGMAAPSRCAAF